MTGFRAPDIAVREEWLDYNGHVTDSAYAVICAAANDNGGGQVVLSGDKSAVARAVEIAKAMASPAIVEDSTGSGETTRSIRASRPRCWDASIRSSR